MQYVSLDTPLPHFMPLPIFIAEKDISPSSKMAYVLIFNRTLLSQRNGFVKDKRVYAVYPLKYLAADLRVSERTVQNLLNELESAYLIERERRGMRKANRIFSLIPEE